MGKYQATDSRRQKMYDTESLFESKLNDAGLTFLRNDKPEFWQKYNDRITKTKWFTRRWDMKQIVVRPGKGYRRAVAWHSPRHSDGVWIPGPSIELPGWARKETVFLHELAHHIVVGSGTVWLSGQTRLTRPNDTPEGWVFQSWKWRDQKNPGGAWAYANRSRTGVVPNDRAFAGHGRLFAATLYDLIGWRMGRQHADLFKQACKETGMKMGARTAAGCPVQKDGDGYVWEDELSRRNCGCW